jgi:AraC family transcriptional regulator
MPIAAFRLDVPTAIGHVEVHRREWTAPIDIAARSLDHRVELCFLPMPASARACFPDHWGPRRFERMGDLFVFPAGEAVHARSDCRRQASVDCCLAPAAIDTWFEGDLAWTSQRLESSLDLASPVIRTLLLRLEDEVLNPGFASDALIELVCAQVAIELSRFYATDTARSSGGLAPWRLKRIDARLADDPTAPSLAELAGICGLSVRQLARSFRASHGTSIGRHIADARIANAKRLLAGDHTVATIAARLGFATSANFSAAFRAATGQTPGQYRQRVFFAGALA